MIRAIIFDCFGVLATEGWQPFKTRYFADQPALAQEASDLLKQADAGLISHEDFLHSVAELAGVSVKEAAALIDNNVPNEPLFDCIKALKAKYKIGVLSNAAANWLEELFGAEKVALFDAVYLSYELGITKPHNRAFEIIAQRLGLEPNECLMVDDKELYCTSAQEAGMPALWYRDFDQFKHDLDRVLQRG